MTTRPRTYISLHQFTAEDVEVRGPLDCPVLRLSPGVELYADTFGELVNIGAEIMRQARLRQAEAAQALHREVVCGEVV